MTFSTGLYWIVAKIVLKYLKGTSYIGLTICKSDMLELYAFNNLD